jgi:hypothetical protein
MGWAVLAGHVCKVIKFYRLKHLSRKSCKGETEDLRAVLGIKTDLKEIHVSMWTVFM